MHWLAALPELLTAGAVLWLWLEPERFGAEWLRIGSMLLLLEFFVVHASGFMAVQMYAPGASRARRARNVGLMALGYLAFVGLFALGFRAPWMLYAFAWLCFAKLLAIWRSGEPTEHERSVAMASWGASVALYLLSVFATLMLSVPRLGVTPEVIEAYGMVTDSEGIWEAEPWRALAGAALYFTLLALTRPAFQKWLQRSPAT